MPFEMTQIKELMERYTWPKAVAVTGALGSGKTEWVLNLALGLKTLEEQAGAETPILVFSDLSVVDE